MDAAGGCCCRAARCSHHQTADAVARSDIGIVLGRGVHWRADPRAVDERRDRATSASIGRRALPAAAGPRAQRTRPGAGADGRSEASVAPDRPRGLRAGGPAGRRSRTVRAHLAEQGHRRAPTGRCRSCSSRRCTSASSALGQATVKQAPTRAVRLQADRRPPVVGAVQKMRVPSGRNAKSERLLARLGCAACASCGGRMVAGGAWATYTTRRARCAARGTPSTSAGGAPTQDCPQPCSISAEKLEALRARARQGRSAPTAGARASRAREAREAAASGRAQPRRAARRRRATGMMLLPEGRQ